MLLSVVILVQWRIIACVSSDTFEDNMVPSDEVFSDLVNSYRGQPEQEITLNLPSDEDALNEIKPILQYGNPFYYSGSVGRFIPSSFPEIDSRGFHEFVFDDLDDLYSVSRRGKRYDSSNTIDRNTFEDGFHISNNNLDRSHGNVASSFTPYHPRGKRWIHVGSYPKFKKSPILQTPKIEHRNGHHSKNYHVKTTKSTSNNITAQDLDSNEHNLENVTSSEIRQKRAAPPWKEDSLREKRKPEMTANGFHADVFGSLNEFETLRKRKADMTDDFNPYWSHLDVQDKRVPEMDKGGFHYDVFHKNFGNFHPFKRAPDMGESGFHGDVFHKSFGNFNTLKRAPEMSQIGFHNDVFHNSFGNFETLRKRKPEIDAKNFNHDAFNRDFGHFDTLRKRKRKPFGSIGRDEYSMDTGLFERDFGNFYTGKRRGNAGAVNGDAFHSNFGIFETLKKRRPESELIGDAFHRSFGNFDPMKRTFTGDAFHSEFGKFETMKRRPNGDANGFANDDFQDQLFGNFNTLKRSTTYPHSQEELNNYVEIFGKMRPHRLDRLRYYTRMSPQDEIDYEKFRAFFQNYALLNKIEDMTKRLQSNNESETSLKSVKNNSSFTH